MLSLPGTSTWPSASDTLLTQRVGHRYDAAGRDTARVGDRGKRTRYFYDVLGRLIVRRPWADSAAVRDSMVYDIAGNLRKTFTRRGHVITHAYDSRNRDTLTVIPGVGNLRRAFGGPQDQVTRLWLANAVDSIGGVNGEVRSGFDARGRLRADTVFTGATPRVTTYAYDPYERPTSTTGPLGTWTVRYETVRGIADTLATPMGDTLVYHVDLLGRLDERKVRYDDSLRMQSSVGYQWNQTQASTVNQIFGAAGSYGSGGFARPVKDTAAMALSPMWFDQHGVGAAIDTLRDSTQYDAWGRLTRWAPMRGNSPDGPGERYSYDRGGNLHVAGETLVIDPITEQLTSRTVGGVTTTYAYDHAGNLVTRTSGAVTWAYGYDPLDRLVSVRRNSVLIARYGYDVLGRRIVKRVYSSASGGTVGYTRFVYKGSHVSFETDSAGTIGLRYTWGAGTDDLVAITTAAGQHYYVTTDKLGSVRSIAKRDGTWRLSQRFDPYGRLIVRDSASGSTIGAQLRYGWTGREWDAETGFSYHRARYFDPESRRWTQEDPIGYAGGVNVYAYVGGSPMESRDPSGAIPSEDGVFRREYDKVPMVAPPTWDGWFGISSIWRPAIEVLVDGVRVDLIPLADLRGMAGFTATHSEYEQRYEANKAAIEASGDMNAQSFFSNSRAMNSSEYDFMGKVIMGVFAGRGAWQAQLAADFDGRVSAGMVFISKGMPRNYFDRTMGSYTAFPEGITRHGRGVLMNAVAHSELHVQLRSSSVDMHCAVYRVADALSGYNMRRRSVDYAAKCT